MEDQVKKDREWRDLVSAVSKKCDWRYDGIIAFVNDLLENSDCHTARKYVVRFMVDEDW